MNTSKQDQQQSVEPADIDNVYEWSYIRVAEGVTTNVVSAILIGSLAILSATVYAGWALLLNVLHVPNGFIGILAFVLLGAMLMLVILVIVIVAGLRGMKSAALAGMLIGALIGAAIGASIDAGKWKIDAGIFAKAQEQKNAAKTGSEQPQ